jgi:hypothetical protein
MSRRAGGVEEFRPFIAMCWVALSEVAKARYAVERRGVLALEARDVRALMDEARPRVAAGEQVRADLTGLYLTERVAARNKPTWWSGSELRRLVASYDPDTHLVLAFSDSDVEVLHCAIVPLALVPSRMPAGSSLN